MRAHDLTPTQVDPAQLTLHPGNPNHGDVEAIADSIRVNGFYEPVIIQASTGYVLSGNHRVKAARTLNLPTVPVVRLDVDDTTARRILLASNATAQKAVTDDMALARVLRLIEQDDEDITGTGYDRDEIDDYLVILDHEDREAARLAETDNEPEPPAPAPAPEPPRATPGATPREHEPAPPPQPRESPQVINPGRRVYILDLPLDAHHWLTAALDELRTEHGYRHRTHALLETIADATGRAAPTLTGPEYTDPTTDGIPTT